MYILPLSKVQNQNFTSLLNNTKVNVLNYNITSNKTTGDLDTLYLIKQKGLKMNSEVFLFSGIDKNSKRYVIFNAISNSNGKSTAFKLTSSNLKFTKKQLQAINLFKDNSLREKFLLSEFETPFNMDCNNFNEKEFFETLNNLSKDGYKKENRKLNKSNYLVKPIVFDFATTERVKRDFVNPKFSTYVIKNGKTAFIYR